MKNPYNQIGKLSIILCVLLVACNPNTDIKPSTTDTRADSLAIAQLFAKTKINKDSSAIFIKQANDIVTARHSVKLQAVYWVLLGKEMIYGNQLDSANSIADRGLQLNYHEDELSLKGKFYNIKGNVAGLKKDIYQSIEYYIDAEKIFQASGDSAALAGVYSNIANSYFSLKDYPSAHQYAGKAYRLLPSVKEAHITSNIMTTYALSLNKVGRTHEALPIIEKADSLSDATQNKMGKIAATIGLAEVYKANHNFDSSYFYYQKCIEQSRELGIKHFELMSRVGLLSLYEEQGNAAAIVNMGDSTIMLANQLQNVDVLHTVKRISGKAYGKQGHYQKGFQLLSESYALYDSVASVETQKNINELLLKYDTEKKEKEIVNQNLLLAEQKIQLRNRQAIILGLVLGLAILLLAIFYVRRLNRERLIRLEIQKQKKIGDAYIQGEQKERTRLAFEIHDGIASMLTGISYKLRGEDADKEQIVALLTTLHEDTRRISHSLMPIDFEQKNLPEAVSALCEKISTNEVEVVFSSDNNRVALHAHESLLFYRIIQELLNNALKYAKCKSIFVRIESSDGELRISVEDDGVGMEHDKMEGGFRSIKERIKALNATMTIDTVLQEGTGIKILYKHEYV